MTEHKTHLTIQSIDNPKHNRSDIEFMVSDFSLGLITGLTNTGQLFVDNLINGNSVYMPHIYAEHTKGEFTVVLDRVGVSPTLVTQSAVFISANTNFTKGKAVVSIRPTKEIHVSQNIIRLDTLVFYV